MTMTVEAIRTSIVRAGDDVTEVVDRHLGERDIENGVIAITSKIVSLAERRLVSRDSMSKLNLIQREADRYLGPAGHGHEMTVTHGLLCASAGIDESNSENGDYILFPADPYESARRLWLALRERRGIKNLGVILTDSHSMPLRRGVTGVGLSHWGFRAVRSLVGRPDVFERPLKYTHVDVLDALAATAVYAMGESNDQTPLALLTGTGVDFTTASARDEVAIAPEDDIYFQWMTGKI